jgi:hypothetical protein
VFRIVLLALRRLSPEERAEVDQLVTGARASFEALDPTTKARLMEFGALDVVPDPALYTVLEDDGRTPERREIIAPMNSELAPGSEVAFEGTVSTLFRDGPTDERDANVSLHFAERVVATDWDAFWSQAPEGPAA